MKKVLCILAALTLCVTLAVVVNVASAQATVPTTCEACGGAEVTWEPLPSGNWRTLDAGHYHYYLTGNDTTYRYTPNPQGDITSTNSGNAVTICLDLNGYNITTNGRALGLYNGCTLNIMDSSEAQTGYIQGTTGDNATVGGTMFSYGTLNLYGGTIRYVYDGVGENQAYAGGVLTVGSSKYSAVFNMYGGRLEGDEMVNHTNSRGGTMLVTNGSQVNLLGGEIISGSVPEGKPGPCVHLEGTAQLTLSGDANVDNIYVNDTGAKVNINGTYSGKSRLTFKNTPTNGKVIGTATNTPAITGDLFCTNGDGWLVNVSGSSVKLATYTSSGERHYCEHCQDVVKWTALTSSTYKTPNTTSGTYHYYLAEDQKLYFQVGASSEKGIYSTACLDLYGNNLTSPGGRALLPWGGSTLNLMDTQGGGIVTGNAGTNNPNGGTVTVSTDGMFNMYGGTLKFEYKDGSTTTKGGTINLNGSMNMYGGKVEGAQLIAPSSGSAVGAAISVNKTNSVLYVSGGEITSGTLPAGGLGACVYVTSGGSSVILAGDAAVDNIYYPSNQQKLTVFGDYTGTANVTYGTAPALGDVVGVSDDAEITGRITCTNGGWLITPEGDDLVISLDAPVAIVTESGDQGFETLQAAIDAYETGYIKLFKPVAQDVTVSKALYIDLNGNTITGAVTVSEGATLYGSDSQTDDYTVADGIYGTVTVNGNVVAQNGYLLINEDGAVSFHKINVAITAMTLRPESAGIYYKSSFLGDEKVAQEVETFGVALSVQGTPNAENIDTACESSEFENFEAGATGNATASTLLKGILKTDNTDAVNLRNLRIEVYGRPYIKTADGYIFGASVSRDLAQQLEEIDNIFDTLNGNQRNAWLTMYEAYPNILEGLSLPNTVEEKEMNDETLSILMVGNSFCYYYVEELYGLMMANPDPNRGYSKVEIYNLYYSGCRLNQHYDWWIAGEAKYDLYKTDENGRKKQTPATGTAWTLEDTLQQGRWDYISLQGMSGEVNYTDLDNLETLRTTIVKYAEPLLDHFHKMHPYAQLLWHRTWAFEVGRISGSTTYTEESLAAYDAGMQAVCDYMCSEFDVNKDYDLVMVNSGAAWPVARQENAKLETSLIPEGGLCARLGVRNENTFPYYTGNANAGDGYHDGDIGGGQFLNACVWYETITGQSVLENTYKPTTENGKYELSDEFADLLRNAAHTALNGE